MRLHHGIDRGKRIQITIDGERVDAFEGETLATAMIEQSPAFRRDTKGMARGMFCNMGTCGECTVTLFPSGRRVRACLVTAQVGMDVTRD